MGYKRIADQQFGVVSRSQLVASGLTSEAIRHRLSKGEFGPVLPKVYRMAGAPRMWEQDVMAAILWAGPRAVASHSTAARLLGLPIDPDRSIHLTVERRMRPPDGIVIHNSKLGDGDAEVERGIPVTSVVRTLLDLGSITSPDRVADAVDDAVRRRLATVAEIYAAGERCTRGRPGSAAFRKAIEYLDTRVINTASVFEGRLLRVLAKSGLPPPVPQHVIRHDGEFVARVDFAYPQWRVALEAHSHRHHSSPRAHHKDSARFNRLQAIDWYPILVAWNDLKKPRGLIRRIEDRRDSFIRKSEGL